MIESTFRSHVSFRSVAPGLKNRMDDPVVHPNFFLRPGGPASRVLCVQDINFGLFIIIHKVFNFILIIYHNIILHLWKIYIYIFIFLCYIMNQIYIKHGKHTMFFLNDYMYMYVFNTSVHCHSALTTKYWAVYS